VAALSNTLKIVVGAILLAVVVSLLWLVIPASPIWICSYVFALIAIACLAVSFVAYLYRSTGIPMAHAFPLTALKYASLNIGISIAAVSIDLMLVIDFRIVNILYALIHIGIFVFFVIRVLAMLSAGENINVVGERAEERHKKLNKDKENYWKK
jgi:hypothetical protein